MKSIALLSLLLPTVSGFVVSPSTSRPSSSFLVLDAKKGCANPSDPTASSSSDVIRARQRLDLQFAQDHRSLHEPFNFDVTPDAHHHLGSSLGDSSVVDDHHQQQQFELEWNRNYQRLKSFYDKNGNVRIPVPRSRKGKSSRKPKPNLYDWCQEQRRRSLLMRLDEFKLAKLLQIGFFNDLVQAGASWNDFFQNLLQFYVQHGHSNVPPASHHLLLAQWVHQQRRYSHLLSAKKRQLLWSVNFCWSQEEADFDAQYRRLRELQHQTTVAATAATQRNPTKRTDSALGQKQKRLRRQQHPQLTVRQWKKIQQSTTKRSVATNESIWQLGEDEVQGLLNQRTMKSLSEKTHHTKGCT